MADKTLDVTVYKPQAVMPVMDIRAAIVRQQAITDFVSSIMRKDTDYGAIPGTEKPTLLKPGAEKLTTFFGLSKRFTLVERVEDWTGGDHGGEPFFYYLYRCQLYSGDVLIAEADGSASSWESKYRYRWVGEFDVPAGLNKSGLPKRGGKITEFVFAVDKAETAGKYGKPAAYWQQFKDAIEFGNAKPVEKAIKSGEMRPAWEIDSTVYRVPNPDPADTVNTILKMSQKRALIAATLLAVNASEFFTQDMEDFVEAEYTVHSEQPKPTPQRAPQPAKPAPAGPSWQEVTDAEFNEMPSASAASNAGNGKSAPAAANGDLPFKDQGSAVQWAARFSVYQKADKKTGHIVPDFPHIVGSIGKVCGELGCKDTDPMSVWGAAFMQHVLDKQAEHEATYKPAPQP